MVTLKKEEERCNEQGEHQAPVQPRRQEARLRCIRWWSAVYVLLHLKVLRCSLNTLAMVEFEGMIPTQNKRNESSTPFDRGVASRSLAIGLRTPIPYLATFDSSPCALFEKRSVCWRCIEILWMPSQWSFRLDCAGTEALSITVRRELWRATLPHICSRNSAILWHFLLHTTRLVHALTTTQQPPQVDDFVLFPVSALPLFFFFPLHHRRYQTCLHWSFVLFPVIQKHCRAELTWCFWPCSEFITWIGEHFSSLVWLGIVWKVVFFEPNSLSATLRCCCSCCLSFHFSFPVLSCSSILEIKDPYLSVPYPGRKELCFYAVCHGDCFLHREWVRVASPFFLYRQYNNCIKISVLDRGKLLAA